MTIPYLFRRRETNTTGTSGWPDLAISGMTFLHEGFAEEVEMHPSAIKCRHLAILI